MAYSLHLHLKYNAWANARIVSVLRTIDDTIYFLDNKSSFPSIAKTAAHIWSAQDIWLRRLTGENLIGWPFENFEKNKEATLDGLIRSSNDLVNFLDSKDGSYFSKRYTYHNLKGELFDDTYEATLFHVVNHSTYHRGQITTMLRQSGETAIGTDLIHYMRKTGKEN